jgi:CubicO group peptidase (beta-lactamase class C family)
VDSLGTEMKRHAEWTTESNAQGATPMETSLQTKLEALIRESMADGLVPGLGLTIVQNDQVLFCEGFGFADLERRTLFTSRTTLQIGSTSKNLTGFAIAQLIERGLVALEASVTAYIPFFKVADARGAAITVRHLLGQVSGLPTTDWVYELSSSDSNDTALEHLVRSLEHVSLISVPGERYEYSNFNYIVLGHIIERVTGQSYETYMQQNVFEPLGMKGSYAPTTDALNTNLEPAKGYVHGSRTANVETVVVMSRQWNASGLIVSNTEDIARYLIAQVEASSILGADALALSHTGLNPAESQLGGETQYAFGWETTVREGVQIVEHGGDARTSGSYFLLLPEFQIGLAVLMNLVDQGKIQLMYQLVKTLLGLEADAYQAIPKSEPIPHSDFKADPSSFTRFAGEYDTVRGRLEVFVQDGEPMMRLAKGSLVESVVRLEAQSANEFVTRSEVLALEGIHFGLDDNGLEFDNHKFKKLETT